jgi:RNA polymerase sigma-70 factor (ECF subfamily)
MPLDSTDLDSLAVWSSPSVTAAGQQGDALDVVIVGLFDRHREPLLRYLLNFGLALPNAEEVIQEAFLLLYQHLRGGRSRENLRGWLFGVAHNLALKRRYRTHRERAAQANASALQPTLSPGLDPEAQAAAKQNHERLMAVVEVLSAQDRQCLTLRAEGLRYREIAQILEISLGGVALSLARSLARVVRAMGR